MRGSDGNPCGDEVRGRNGSQHEQAHAQADGMGNRRRDTKLGSVVVVFGCRGETCLACLGHAILQQHGTIWYDTCVHGWGSATSAQRKTPNISDSLVDGGAQTGVEAGGFPQPTLPAGEHRAFDLRGRHRRTGSQRLGEQLLQPGMQHRIGGARYSFDPHPAAGGVEGVSSLSVPVRTHACGWRTGVPFWLPAGPRIGLRLIRARLILTPYRYPSGLRLAVRPLYLPHFCSVCGSLTVTTPLLRTRCAVPVGLRRAHARCPARHARHSAVAGPGRL